MASLAREFGLAYPLVSTTAQYLPVLEAARDLLVVNSDEPAGVRVALGLPSAWWMVELHLGCHLRVWVWGGWGNRQSLLGHPEH